MWSIIGKLSLRSLAATRGVLVAVVFVAQMLMPLSAAARSCDSPDPYQVGFLADDINKFVIEAEKEVCKQNADACGRRPGLVMHFQTGLFDEYRVDGSRIEDSVVKAAVRHAQRSNCPNINDFTGSLKRNLQYSRKVRFLAFNLRHRVMKIVKQIDSFGSSNVSQESNNVLKVHQVNYILFFSPTLTMEYPDTTLGYDKVDTVSVGYDIESSIVSVSSFESAILHRIASPRMNQSEISYDLFEVIESVLRWSSDIEKFSTGDVLGRTKLDVRIKAKDQPFCGRIVCEGRFFRPKIRVDPFCLSPRKAKVITEEVRVKNLDHFRLRKGKNYKITCNENVRQQVTFDDRYR